MANKKPNRVHMRLVPVDIDGEQKLLFQTVATTNEKTAYIAASFEKVLNKGIDMEKAKIIKTPHSEAQTLVEGREDLWINQLKKQNKPSLHPSIQMKHFDQDGLPIDGYDYSKHFAKDNEEGEIIGNFIVPKEEIKGGFDVDYKPEELTPEQREIYYALMNEENLECEEIEDDFVIRAQGGDAIFVNHQQVQQQPEKKQIEKQQEKQPEKQQKKVTFQDDQDSWEDEGEGEYEYEVEEYDEDDDEEFDSDLEKQFEEEMNNYDHPKQEEKRVMNEQKLNDVIEDHLKHHPKKNKKAKKGPRPLSKEEQEYQEEQRLLNLKVLDPLAYMQEVFPNVDPQEFHIRKQVPDLPFEKDQVLLNYINRETSDEELPDMPEAPNDVEDIVSKSIHNTQMSKMSIDQLNVIKFQQKKPKNICKPNLEAVKEEQVQKNKIDKEILQQLVLERDADKDEKKQRKQLIKDLKQAKKDKKRQFKEKMKEVSKQHINSKNANKQQFVEGVAIVKL